MTVNQCVLSDQCGGCIVADVRQPNRLMRSSFFIMEQILLKASLKWRYRSSGFRYSLARPWRGTVPESDQCGPVDGHIRGNVLPAATLRRRYSSHTCSRGALLFLYKRLHCTAHLLGSRIWRAKGRKGKSSSPGNHRPPRLYTTTFGKLWQASRLSLILPESSNMEQY